MFCPLFSSKTLANRVYHSITPGVSKYFFHLQHPWWLQVRAKGAVKDLKEMIEITRALAVNHFRGHDVCVQRNTIATGSKHLPVHMRGVIAGKIHYDRSDIVGVHWTRLGLLTTG